MQATDRAFDYIVIGAGSAGCVLAARLSEQSNLQVLLIEAGKDANGWTIRMPLAVDRLLNGRTYNWGFETEPEAGLQGRSIGQPRGRVVGGSSAINGMVYTRGNPRDYDEWAEVYGCDGWDYASLLPYFRRMETAPGGDPRYRGTSGPLKITRPNVSRHALNAAFIAAGRQAGHPVTEDHNGRDHEGFTVGEQTIHNGQRCSTAVAYLTAKVRARPNLTILPEALVERLLFQDRRAIGVQCRLRDGQRQFAARREIVLSAGAVGTPHLLKLSGVGPAEELRRFGIDVVHDLPSVGENLQDHPDLVIQFACKQRVTLRRHTGRLGRIPVGLQWFLFKRGVAASNQFEVGAYLHTRSGLAKPNIKLEFFPLALQHTDYKPYPIEAFQIHMTMMAAASRGTVTLRSANPAEAPVLRLNYLDSATDMQTFREALRLTRDLVKAPAFAPYAGAELDPGEAIQSDAALDDWIRQRVMTAYHLSCSCRMGRTDDPAAVVGPDLAVRGLAGLRIADASVMPHVVTANTNATTIMIGEHAADLCLGRGQTA